MAGGGNNTISGAFPIQHGFSGVYHKGYLVYHIVYVVLFTFSGEKLFQQRKKKILMNILLVAEGCLMMQFRNNAVYAVAVFMLLLLILRPKKEKLGILILGICLVLGETGMRNVIQTVIGTRLEAPKIEAYSVPIQQFARVAYYHGEELEVQDPELAALLENMCREIIGMLIMRRWQIPSRAR